VYIIEITQISLNPNKTIGKYHSLSSQSITYMLMPNNTVAKQEAQLMMTIPYDVFRGQSRSPDIVPFHMLSIVYY